NVGTDVGHVEKIGALDAVVSVRLLEEGAIVDVVEQLGGQRIALLRAERLVEEAFEIDVRGEEIPAVGYFFAVYSGRCPRIKLGAPVHVDVELGGVIDDAGGVIPLDAVHGRN